MLKELSRKERVAKIETIANREECKFYSLYYDYYKGIHFIKTDMTATDYGKNSIYRITTRSGIELFDTPTDEDKVVVKSNWCKPIAETIGDYTRGINKPIVVTSKLKEKELQKVWEDNKINTLIHSICYQSGIFGKTYLRLRKRDKIELVTINPDEIFEVKNPITDETESVIWYFEIDTEQAERMFSNVSAMGKGSDINKGFVYYAEEWDNGRVSKYIDGQLINETNEEGVVKDINPYGFIPFFEIKGNVYNQSDISDVISLNDELNITLSYINEITKYHAFPIVAPKGTYDANTPALSKEQLREVEVGPRTILPIPMERIAGEGINQTIIEHLEALRKDIAVVSGVPVKILTAEIGGNVAGVALKRMMSSIVKQAEVRRNFIKETYKEINNKILSLLAGKPVEIETNITFPEIIEIDTNERLDEMLKKQSLGISKDTIFKELGYDYEEESQKSQEEFDKSIEKRLLDEHQSLQQNSARQPKKGNSPK